MGPPIAGASGGFVPPSPNDPARSSKPDTGRPGPAADNSRSRLPDFVQKHPLALSPTAVIELQRLVGNRATSWLLQRDRSQAAIVTADAAANQINSWLRQNPPPGQAVNYCVGVASNGDLYISKINGVTAATAYVAQQLGPYITNNNLHLGRDVYLAQKFNNAVGSNHAEMCIMAAAGQGQISKIYCSGPHCGFCSAVMSKDNVALGAAQGNDEQQGWAHPFVPLSYGSQFSNDTEGQLTELKGLPLLPGQHQIQKGGWMTTSPTPGKRTLWL